jgi:hypothetical protein
MVSSNWLELTTTQNISCCSISSELASHLNDVVVRSVRYFNRATSLSRIMPHEMTHILVQSTLCQDNPKCTVSTVEG